MTDKGKKTRFLRPECLEKSGWERAKKKSFSVISVGSIHDSRGTLPAALESARQSKQKQNQVFMPVFQKGPAINSLLINFIRQTAHYNFNPSHHHKILRSHHRCKFRSFSSSSRRLEDIRGFPLQGDQGWGVREANVRRGILNKNTRNK